MLSDELKVIVQAEVDRAVREIRGLNQQTQRSQQRFQTWTRSLARHALAFAGVTGAIATLNRTIRDSLQDWADIEAAQNRVANAARIAGEDVQTVVPRYHELASEIQELTVVSDTAALEMIALAQSMGVASSDMDEVVRGAVGLSRTFGIDTQQAIRAVINAMEGNTEQLGRYIPAVRNASNEAEAMAAVQDAMANGFEMAQAETETLAGRQAQLGNAISDVREEIGQFIAGPGGGMIEWATDLANRLADQLGLMNEIRAARDRLAAGEGDRRDEITLLENQIRQLEQQKQTIEGTARVSDAARERSIEGIERQIAERRRELELMQEMEAAIEQARSEERQRDEEWQRRHAEIVAEYEAEREAIRELNEANEQAGERAIELDRERLSPLERRLVQLQEERDLVQGQINDAIELGAQWGQLANVRDILNERIRKTREELEAHQEAQRQAARQAELQEMAEEYERIAAATSEMFAFEDDASGFIAWIENLEHAEQAATELEQTLDRISEHAFWDVTREGVGTFRDLGVSIGDANRETMNAVELAGAFARRLLDLLPGTMLEIARAAARDGQWALALGLVGAAATAEFTAGVAGGATANAKGNVYDQSGLVAFAKGGVVDRPTVFPFARGAGLMGEAGPEAILPLRRGRNGELGVQGGGSVVNVNIKNYSGAEVRQRERDRGDGEKELEIMIGTIVDRHQSTGRGDSSMKANYGVKRRPI